MDNIKIPAGISDFTEIREGGYSYVDKTRFIEDVINGPAAIQIMRPPQFGKTVFLSMLSSFFDIRSDSRDLFAGLEIMNDSSFVEKWMNKHPVISFSMKSVVAGEFPEAIEKLGNIISKVFADYSCIHDSIHLECDRNLFGKFVSDNADSGDIQYSLRFISELLKDHYGSDVIVLIDDCDAPLKSAVANGYYKRMLSFLNSFYASVLKDNGDVIFGVAAGNLMIPNDSLFSGLNNLSFFTVADYGFSTAFGFTENEVIQLLSETNLADDSEDIRRLYGGYRIGRNEIYSPSGVIQYITKCFDDAEKKDSKPSDIICDFINDYAVSEKISSLIDGEHIIEQVTGYLSYDIVKSSESAFWSYLLAMGCLTLAKQYDMTKPSVLRVPDEAAKEVFINSVDSWFKEHIQNRNREFLFPAIWNGDAKTLATEISDYLFTDAITYYSCRLDYYCRFLFLLFVGTGCDVSRIDDDTIFLIDNLNCRVAVFEIKRADSRENLSAVALKAAQQIADRKYGEDLSGYKSVVSYGVAFFEKEACVALLG